MGTKHGLVWTGIRGSGRGVVSFGDTVVVRLHLRAKGGRKTAKAMVWTGSEYACTLWARANLCSWSVVSIASVESAHTSFVPFVTQFRTSAAVVDEPIAHLRHANAGRLFVSSQR